jgi:Raf kinase inhibitor-like YbhB/YbcL family protein
MPLKLTIGAFPEGALIPALFTCEGADVSPSLEWSGAPDQTKSFAIVMDDPDAPGGTWTHWVLFDLPASVHSLAQGYKPGSLGASGKNDFGKPGYGGPCPPKGHGAHRYFFKLYALGVPSLGLKAGAARAEVDKAVRGHILAETQYMGRFERK